jgi:peptidoglycan/xylan/chitin deacetylase (PgdA/CDA1 family)
MCASDASPEQLWELVLYALPPVLDEFPAELFFDDDIVWHQQQFGLAGQVATAALVERGSDLYLLNLLSDVVQRIGRRRELKTRVENRFKGWSRLLVNAVLDFALDRGARRVLVASADWALLHTDRARAVQRPLFDRVYDGSVGAPYRAAREGQWWVLDVATNADAVLRAPVGALRRSDEPQICVCHDIERGWGHLDDDPAFAAAIDVDAPAHLAQMLEIEAAAGVRATYSIVGFLIPELGEQVRSAGHTVAFHSFDHAGPGDPDAEHQLGACREIDYRIKGYRPAQSHLTRELTDANLAFHNFEWLASSQHSLGTTTPALVNGVVRIPLLFDDFDLHHGAAYGEWEAAGLRAIEETRGAAFSLHDCYGATWLDHYPALLRRVGDLGRFRTLDDVAAEVLLARAV